MKKEYRIKREKDFHDIIKTKKNFANKHFVIYFKKNKEIKHFRVGISVNKRVGKAFKRNKLKRYVREFFKYGKNKIENYDIVVIIRKEATNLDFENFYNSLKHVLKKKKLLKKEGKNEKIHI